MADVLPTGNDKDVSLFPMKYEVVANVASAFSFNWNEDRRVRGSISTGCESLWQKLDEGADRTHGVVTGDRIRVTHFDPVAWIPIPCGSKPLKRFPRTRIGIVENGRAAATWLVIHWQEIRTIPRVTIACGARQRLFILSKVLREGCVKELHQRNVKTIQPEDRVLAVISVVVPRHGRRNDEITLMHDCAFAVDVGVGSIAFEHKPERALGMTVCGRDLAGQNQLHTCI